MTRTAAVATDLMVGVVAGLAAALAMNIYQAAVSRALSAEEPSETTAMKAADAVSETISGAPVKRRYKDSADAVLHYLTGAVAGGIYGVACGMVPALTAGRGLLFGALVWGVAEVGIVPALGLAPPPTETDVREHGFALSAHLVFGVVLDFIRRQVNTAISPLATSRR